MTTAAEFGPWSSGTRFSCGTWTLDYGGITVNSAASIEDGSPAYSLGGNRYAVGTEVPIDNIH